ncbi:sheath polysaccharide-degrading enzyme [Paenibacillus cremeus]|uniref:Sheath polysaccharide-degrading enzyme n=1 Tax=Paenibacillus cremeus TaxID=2163881 RepID=A0A559JKE4_9BACL|nr:sheath polysaccharide-degrading enzyme [Paenibacillus cremeus]
MLAAGVTFTGKFTGAIDGTSAAPITIESASATNKAILSGSSGTGSGTTLTITGDYWIVKNVKVTNSQKGILFDNTNHSLIDGAEVYNTGQEAVHFRDGSSYCTIQNSYIHDAGVVTADYGEGVYVGSDSSASYNHTVIGNSILNNTIGPNVAAEHIDIKEGADGTLVQGNTFNGTGISGANSADSFVDVKGVNSQIYNNTGSRNGNANVVDAFQVHTHGTAYPTGTNNDFSGNSVNMDGVGYIVNVPTGDAKVHNNTRSDGSTSLYNGNYTTY